MTDHNIRRRDTIRPLASIPQKAKYERHGMNKTPEHQAWVGMRQRCHNHKKLRYESYGGRGIKICERWSTFLNFYEDVGPRPGPAYSIDRINVDGDYEPGNVRWATDQQQVENRRVSIWVTHDGETCTQREWERKKGLARGTIGRRIRSGWSFEKAVSTPSVKGQKIYPATPADLSGRARHANGQFCIPRKTDETEK